MTDAPVARAKKPVPWRGRMRVKDARKRFIAVRCTEKEHAAIAEKAEEAGLAVGAFLRKLALGDAGPRAVRKPLAERKELARLVGHLGKIGSNINQLAHGFNRDRVLPAFVVGERWQRFGEPLRNACKRAWRVFGFSARDHRVASPIAPWRRFGGRTFADNECRQYHGRD
jgi:hypothetical protein